MEKINKEHENDDMRFNSILVNEIQGSPIKSIHSMYNLLSEGVVAIFGDLNDKSTRNAVENLCDNKEIPLLEIGWNGNPQRSTTAISFYPSNKILSELYLGIIDYFKWRSFLILYEDDASLIRLSSFLKGIDGRRYKQILLERLDQTDDGNYR